jgi:replication factor C subunit 2/4
MRKSKQVEELLPDFCKRNLVANENYSHKTVVLDEVDNMTPQAQYNISDLMDEYKDTTRFIMICNKSNKIIETIQSKCIILNYTKISKKQIVERLKYICGKEKVKYTDSGLRKISYVSQGDLRQSINNLQLVWNGSDNVNTKNVTMMCNVPDIKTIKNLLIECQNKDFSKALVYVLELVDAGFTIYNIASWILYVLKDDDDILDLLEENRIKFLEDICDLNIKVIDGINSKLQITGMVAKMCM